MTPQKEIEDRVWILERLKSEYRKHGKTEGLDWMAIAANKIAKSLSLPTPDQVGVTEGEIKDWTNIDKDGFINVPDELDNLVNSALIQVQFHKISKIITEEEMACRIVYICQKHFSKSPPPTILTTISELGEGEIPEYVADYINDTKIEGNERAEIMVKRNLLLFYEYIKEDIEPLRKELLYAKTEAAQLRSKLSKEVAVDVLSARIKTAEEILNNHASFHSTSPMGEKDWVDSHVESIYKAMEEYANSVNVDLQKENKSLKEINQWQWDKFFGAWSDKMRKYRKENKELKVKLGNCAGIRIGANFNQIDKTKKSDQPVVSGSLSFDDALNRKMNWGDVIRYWKPNATDEECQSVYDEMKRLAYKDGVLSFQILFKAQGYICACTTSSVSITNGLCNNCGKPIWITN